MSRKYVPELKKFPVDYIYEPWKAPLGMQRTAGCIIGQDYPRRIVIHEDVYKENIKKMSNAYKANKKDDGGDRKRPAKAEAGPRASKKKK